MTTETLLPGPAPGPTSFGPASSWASLEKFLADLERADADDLSSLLLTAILDVTEAEAVALVPAGSGAPVVLTDGSGPRSAEVQTIVARLLEVSRGKPATGTLEAEALAGIFRGWGGPIPTSAALVPAGRSRPAWVVAMTFTPDRTLTAGAVGAMGLAVRLLRTRQRSLRAAADLSETLLGVVQGFAAAIDAKDPYTYGHSERVARMARLIGSRMGLTGGVVNDLYLAGLLHDIGKIGVPEEVLRKPSQLTPDEFLQIQAHPVIGERILAGIRQLDHIRPGVRSHHERWDGLGYPDGLLGEDIPLLARVLAVADSCDAMLSARPYRLQLGSLNVEAEMVRGSGSQWDPSVVEGFLACRQEVYAIREVGLGASVCAAINHAVEVAGSSRSGRSYPGA
jgi:HD-GYP domain-containing protein (c-di-GMP phosphodiesterase class II)